MTGFEEWESFYVIVGAAAGALIGLQFVVMTLVARRQTAYRPDAEDWIAHVLLPVVGYVALLVAAVFASAHPEEALFGVAGGVLLILFVGIHNAWDAIIWHVAVTRQRKAE